MQTWPGGGPGGRETPTPEQVAAWRRRSEPPSNELPAVVGVTAVLGRSSDAVIGLVGLQVFTTGLTLLLSSRLRIESRREDAHRLSRLLLGVHPRPEDDAKGRLLLGVEYADGRMASTLLGGASWPGAFAEPDDDGLVLVPRGGSGGARQYDHRFWLSPLPPPGRLLVICSCSALGIEETTIELEGGAVIEAAARVQVLWELEPEQGWPRASEPPAPPTSGWFSRPELRRERERRPPLPPPT